MTSWERRKESNGFTELQRPDREREREREETRNIDIIKDKTGKILFQDELINARWVAYFEELLNVENEREEMADVSRVEGSEKELELQEIREAMKRMKNNRAPGVSEVSIDMVKAGEEECMIWMIELLKAVWEEENIPKDWSKSLIVPIFKKKGASWSVETTEV